MSRSLLILLFLLFPVAAQDNENEQANGERQRVVYLRAIPIEKGGSAEAALKVYNDWVRSAGDTPIPASVMERMYGAAGEGSKAFKIIALLIDKGLTPEDIKDSSIKNLKIDNRHSVQMAEIREANIETVIREILQSRDGEWKIARSDSGNTASGMKSDLDQTFYVFRKGPYGQWVRDAEADAKFINQFDSTWKERFPGLSLDAVDVASIQGKNRFPDPRDTWVNFESKFFSTIDALRRTPGAYTYGGAVAQQMQFRALAEILNLNPRSFQQYTADGKLEFNKDAAIRHMFGIPPALQPAHAYGASVANFLELQQYMKKDKFETKYHLRTWEDGALVEALDEKLVRNRQDFLALNAEGREHWNGATIDRMFTDPKARKLHRIAMDVSADLRLVHKDKLDVVFPDGDPGSGPGRDAVVFDKLAREMFGTGKPTAGQIKAASLEHRRLASEFCLESVFFTAEEAFRAMGDERFHKPLDVSGYEHLFRGIDAKDLPRVKKNIQTAARITFLYSLYDLGWWKSAQLMGRLHQKFPELAARSLLSLWAQGRVQEILAPIRNPELRPKLPDLKIEIDPDAAQAYVRYLRADVLPDLNRRVQIHIAAELGFARAEKAKSVRGLLKLSPRTWSPARFARNMVWDPGSIDALAQIVRTYITTKGDLEATRAVLVDEIVLAVPVAGQLISATRGGIQGAVLMAGAIQFPVVGIGLLVVSVGQAGYAIYDAEYAEHARNNVVDGVYRGFAGPATRVYEDAPQAFTKNDALRLKVMSTRVKRGETDAKLVATVRELRAKKKRWVAFRDGSWAGGYFSQWGAVKEQKFVRNSLLASIPPIVSFSPSGIVDFRMRFNEQRYKTLEAELARGPGDVDSFLEKEAEFNELAYAKAQVERARRYLDYALGRPNRAVVTERERRSGVPELLFKIRRDSLYPALLEWAQRRKNEIGNAAQANPDRFVEWWFERRGAVAAGELKRHGLAISDKSDIPLQELKDRLTRDVFRSKTIWERYQSIEKMRGEQARIRLQNRKQAYDAEAAGLYIADLDASPGALGRAEHFAALRVAAVPRQAPIVDATIYAIGGRLRAHTRVRMDRHIFPGPYQVQVHQLSLRDAQAAIRSGEVDGVPLLVRDQLAAAVQEARKEAQDAMKSDNAIQVVIPMVSVFSTNRRDLTRALRGTVDRLPSRRTNQGYLLGQVVPAGESVTAGKETPPPPPEEEPRTVAEILISRPRKSIADRRMTFDKVNAVTCTTDRLWGRTGQFRTLFLFVPWPDCPRGARVEASIHVSGGFPANDEKKKKHRPSPYKGSDGGPSGFLVRLPIRTATARRVLVKATLVATRKSVELGRKNANVTFTIRISPLKVTGSTSRDSSGVVSAGMRVEGVLDPGDRLVRMQAGSGRNFSISSGKGASVRIYDGHVPKTGSMQFKHYGDEIELSTTLVRRSVQPIKPFDPTHVQDAEEGIRLQEAHPTHRARLFHIAHEYERIALAYLGARDPSVVDRAAIAIEKFEKTLGSVMRAAQSKEWKGYRHDRGKFPERVRPGVTGNTTAALAWLQRFRVHTHTRFARRAMKWGRTKIATESIRFAEKALPFSEKESRASLHSEMERIYRPLCSMVFRMTGDVGAARALHDDANRHRVAAGLLQGKKLKPRKFPFEIR